MQKFTLTRWHKITQRMTAELQRLEVEAAANVQVRSLDLDALQTRGPKLVEDSRLAFEKTMEDMKSLMDAMTTIRTAVARANADLGVNELLSRMNAATRHNQVLAGILQAAQGRRRDAQSLGDATAALELAAKRMTQAKQFERQTAEVRVLPSERLDELDAEMKLAKKEVVRLSDELSDKNAQKLSIEFKPEWEQWL